jgi:hypothetical protein
VIIDPAGELVNKIKRWGLSDTGADIFFTTGSAENMKIAARNAFGVRISKVRRVSL